MLLVVGVLVGMMIHVIGGGVIFCGRHNGGYICSNRTTDLIPVGICVGIRDD